MPNIKSAKKKVRQDKKRAVLNKKYKESMTKLIKSLGRTAKKISAEQLKKAYSIIDKAMKKKIIHKNRAARLKSRISKLISREK
ncbi:MAG: 30S ribosomal protein S20 [Candidatus Roizmanbacteria bacterium]|nr:MAG: 30S ribosomal protein S20 [Candidatus Roizmanbacteria bacterium]